MYCNYLSSQRFINKLLAQLEKNRFVIVSSDYSINQFGEGLSICIPGTEGHKTNINADITLTSISKEEHSCFSSIKFVNYLHTNNIEKLVLCGFLAEYCVRSTAIDALKDGYMVSLLDDCIGAGDDVRTEKRKVYTN